MSKLNAVAAGLASRYIKASSTVEPTMDSRRKRGLQAEINKVESIRKVILNSNIDTNELLRFRTELNKLVNMIDGRLSITERI